VQAALGDLENSEAVTASVSRPQRPA
jgi:hypothetical protein